MMSFIVLLLAALSRLVPHALRGVGLNFTAVGGGLLFFGARRSPWFAAVGAAVMALTDVYLTHFVYGLTFHPQTYLVTWAWYAGVCLLGSAMLRRTTAFRVAAASFCSATSFFILSNLVVWIGGGLYLHTPGGLLACYRMAVPFYANDLVSTGLTCAVLFGLPAVARQLLETWRRVMEQGQPLS